MRNKIIALFAFVFAAALFTACMTSKKSTAAFHSYPTECVSQNTDGKMLLKVYARGVYSKDAITEAMKKALDDVIFNGITAGESNRYQIALVIDANARSKYEDYFNRFFADEGAYTQYVSRDKFHYNAKKRLKSDNARTRGIVVLVDTQALKERLKHDGIIK